MAKPILLTVDDEPHVLNAVVRDLQERYRSGYRIVKAASGSEALDAVQQFKRRGTPVALLLVDQRMPGMSGIEFLTEAIKLFPESKRVLLTAYADTDAAIMSINEIDLDYYLMKPWDPPEERLYPVLDDLLDDWAANVPVPYDGSESPEPCGRPVRTWSRSSWRAARSRTGGSTSTRTTRHERSSRRPPSKGGRCRCCSSPTDRSLRTRVCRALPTRSVSVPPRSSPSTT